MSFKISGLENGGITSGAVRSARYRPIVTFIVNAPSSGGHNDLILQSGGRFRVLDSLVVVLVGMCGRNGWVCGKEGRLAL